MKKQLREVLESDQHPLKKLEIIKGMNIVGSNSHATFIREVVDHQIGHRDKVNILTNLFVENDGKKLDLSYALKLLY